MEELKHECGIALIRLCKPIEYYASKYGSSRYVLGKLYLLMHKQHNRGQDGAGIACVSLSAQAGEEFMFRERKEGKNAIAKLFSSVNKQIATEGIPFIGECYMGHLRYSTTGSSGLAYVHPHLRRSIYRKNTLALCGNFNLTNVDKVFAQLASQGQHPRRNSDTTVLLEQLGYLLDQKAGNLQETLQECIPTWDGGFVLCGMTGAGEMFAARDPWGIRTAFWYADDELIVVASERPAIQTVINASKDSIREIGAGETLFISASGENVCHTVVRKQQFDFAYGKKPKFESRITPCSFERIYFSRGNDHDIYQERKQLGRAVVPQILAAIDYDLENTVFSFIPNTAEVAFMGMLEGLNDYLNEEKCRAIEKLGNKERDAVSKIISRRIRAEKVAIKDIKLRTFISESDERNQLANHVYDITYGSIRPKADNLVVIDDSIVRGTTLRQSIITILARLNPRKMVIVSSAPQIRYPDFYGIDMSNVGDLIAFRAALELCRDRVCRDGVQTVTSEEIYQKCVAQQALPEEQMINYAAEIYKPFSDAEISEKIVELITPEEVICPVELIFQQRETLSEICPNNSGDWYFTGNYPTKGGMKRMNDALLEYLKHNTMRTK